MIDTWLRLLAEAGSYAMLIFIAYEDFRYRGITWYCFVLLAVLFLYQGYLSYGIESLFFFTLINVLFVLLQILFVSLYFSLQLRRWVNITKAHLGWGDLLFFFVTAMLMNPAQYIFFYVSSLVIILTLVALVALFRWKIFTKEKNIPLAGIQALLLTIHIFISHHFPDLLKDFNCF